jgi:cytochrome c oxidase subunit IV
MAHVYNAETYKAAKKEIWKITWILSFLTIVELVLGFWMYFKKESLGVNGILFVKGVILILMVVKAFYIVAYFMHLKHEIKNMVMTIVVPLSLFIWFIISFLYEGNSYNHLRNTYDKNYEAQKEVKVQEKHHEAGATHNAGEEHNATEGKHH